MEERELWTRGASLLRGLDRIRKRPQEESHWAVWTTC